MSGARSVIGSFSMVKFLDALLDSLEMPHFSHTKVLCVDEKRRVGEGSVHTSPNSTLIYIAFT